MKRVLFIFLVMPFCYASGMQKEVGDTPAKFHLRFISLKCGIVDTGMRSNIAIAYDQTQSFESKRAAIEALQQDAATRNHSVATEHWQKLMQSFIDDSNSAEVVQPKG